MIMGVAFLRPWWLLALLPAALLVWRLGRAPEGGAAAWRRVVAAHLLPHLLEGADSRRRRKGLALLAASLGLAILALAGPVGDNLAADTWRREATRILVVDLSVRMAAADGAISRLERAKPKILDLLRALPDGQSALVIYAGEPYLVAPPTTDAETIARFVPELAVDAVPVQGNNPGRALGMAARILARSASGARDLVWITAGNAGGTPLPEAAGLRLSILHAAPADDPGLAAAASRTGGIYLRMGADGDDVRRLAAFLAAGGGWRADARQGSRNQVEVGYWLLLPLLVLAALGFRRGLLACVAAPLLLAGSLLPSPAQAATLSGWLADWQAWRRLQAGDYEGAAAGFKDSRWGAVARYRAGRFDEAAALLEGLGDADSRYNRGNALARQGRLADALAAYETALKLRPGDADTRHNRDLVLRLLKQPKGAGQRPPPPPNKADRADSEREAAQLAEQWLRRVPDEPGSLLRRKLLAEHRRRLSGEAPAPW